jgi:hypothetical protein
MEFLNIHKDKSTNEEVERFTLTHVKYLDPELINSPEKFNELVLLFSRTNVNNLIRYFFRHYIIGDPNEATKRELVRGISLIINHRKKQAEIAMIEFIMKIKNEMPDKELAALRTLISLQVDQIDRYGIEIQVNYSRKIDRLYHLSQNYSDNLMKYFSDIMITESDKFSSFVKKYEKLPDNIGKLEMLINRQLRQVVRDLRSRIIEMYQWDMSYNKIQKKLTQECIDQGRIPSQVTRLSRAKQSSGNIVKVDTLLPINEIKKVISDSQLV